MLGMLTGAAFAAGSRRPNILYIMAHDHAAHAISAYGSKINQTPNIDRIAKDGMRFSQCQVTNSICTPSRAAILTGKYAHINGVPVFNRFDGSQPTLAKYLQAAGYHTGMIGKWHLGSEPTGFDYWNILPGQGVYHNPVLFELGQRTQYSGYVTDVITDLSLAFLDKRPKDKPFFLMCHHKAPHRPWEPDEKHAKQWENVQVPEPATFNDDYATRSDAAREATMRIDRDLKPTDVKKTPPPGLSAEELKKWNYQRFLPLRRGETPKDWRTSMYYRYYHYPQDHRVQPHYGVRTAKYKLIYFNKIDQWELFDLAKDPHELKNLYADPAYAETVKTLKEEMFRLKKELKDENQFENEQPPAGVDGPPKK